MRDRLCTAQLCHHLFETVGAHADAQVTFRKQHVPFAVGDHLKRFIQSFKDLSEGVVAGPATQTTPERRSGFELKSLPLKAMGRTTGMTMGLQDENIKPCPRTQRRTAQSADPAADHDHLMSGGHR